MPDRPPRNSLSSPLSGLPSHWSSSSAAVTSSFAPSTRSLRLLDPALTTRTLVMAARRWTRLRRRRSRLAGGTLPGPALDLGQVIAVLAGPGVVPGARIDHLLAKPGRLVAHAGNPPHHPHHHVQPAHLLPPPP